MKPIMTGFAILAVCCLAACGTEASQPTASRTIAPSATSPPATATPAPASAAQPAEPAAPVTVPNVTDPWAVVSAYYGAVESGDYPEAWALLSSGMVTGQSYQQFVAGYACTGGEQLTDLGETGDQVTFSLTATDDCTGAVRYYTGTDTVADGKIVAADVTQTG